ncbi:MAG: ferredoxin [Acidobacteria bacterium]|nr:MAG: ferredoxin [Acidobacteriota bacterium]
MAKITDIEGIGPANAEKLKAAGVNTLEGLLKLGCEKKGRKGISEKAGIDEKTILNWVNRADLTRIKGVSTQYADLLKFAGVDTVPELAQRNAANLTAKMIEVNTAKKLVRKLPTESQVTNWVAQAKELPRIIKH